jgi:hypothetical protein
MTKIALLAAACCLLAAPAFAQGGKTVTVVNNSSLIIQGGGHGSTGGEYQVNFALVSQGGTTSNIQAPHHAPYLDYAPVEP